MTNDPDPSDRVTNALSGDVYGTVVQTGAYEVHQHHATRRHVVEDFPPPAPRDARWLMAQPSRLLDARSQVVPFQHRDDELRQLTEWRDDDARLSVVLVHAPGGQGKTRLAAEFAARSRRSWTVRQASLGTGAGLRADAGEAGTLLIVDYADRWAHGELLGLFSELLVTPQPVRVLMLGRSVRWFAALRGELSEHRVPTTELALPHLTADRRSVFAAARDRYAAHDLYDLSEVDDVEPPGSLEDPEFGLVLTLHTAALVAVDARSRGQVPPSDPHELSAYLLDREYMAWQRLYDAGRQGADYRTPPAEMARTVFTAALTGPTSHRSGERTLARLALPEHPQRLLLDHRLCYPPADRAQVLEPLYPDRLAEDFLALLTPGHDVTAYDPDPWTTDGTAGILARVDGVAPQWTPRSITFLAAAAQRWPHLGPESLFPLLAGDPRLALDAGSAALTALAGLESNEVVSMLETVEGVLPADLDYNLDSGIAAVAERLTEHRLSLTDDPRTRAMLHDSLSLRYAHAGMHGAAVGTAETAVAIWRQLDDSAALAGALTNLAAWLSNHERPREGLPHVREALSLWRRLIQDDPVAAHRHGLATVLVNHSAMLLKTGATAEALAEAEEATWLFRQLLDSEPDVYLREFVAGLTNLSSIRAELGQREEGLTAVEEAAVISRRLARADPSAHLLRLAQVVLNLGPALTAMGRHDEALRAAEEATAIWRRLVEANPGAHLPSLAGALNNLSATLAELKRRDEALAAAEESVSIRRQLAVTDPAAHLPDLARSLNNLGARLSDLQRWPGALLAAREAVQIRRQLAQADPEVHLGELAGALVNLGRVFAKTERMVEAVQVAEESVLIRRQLAQARPAAHLGDLASALASLGIWTASSGQQEKAVAALSEARTLYRQLTGPQARPSYFAESTAKLSEVLLGLMRWDEALPVTVEAVQLRRELAQADQEPHLRLLAASLANLRGVLLKLDRGQDAVPVAEELAEVLHELEDLPWLAETLGSLADLLQRLGRRAEALRTAQEAAAVLGQLVTEGSAAHLPEFARFMAVLSDGYAEAGYQEEALSHAETASGIFRLLAGDDDAHLPALGRSLSELGIRAFTLGRFDQGVAAIAEAVEVRRRLDEAGADLAGDLYNLGRGLAMLGRHEQALAPAEEAVRVWRRLSQEHVRHLPELGRAVGTLSTLLSGLGRPAEALPLAEETCEIFRRLADQHSGFLPDLAKSLGNLSGRLAELGEVDRALPVAEETCRLLRSLAEADPAYLPLYRDALRNLTLITDAEQPPARG